MKRAGRFLAAAVAVAALLACAAPRVRAQAADGDLSQAEIESLRDAAYLPVDRIRAYEKILNDREKRIEDLLAKPRRPGFALDMHDALDQFGAIADELNDNLDEYNEKHRDIRKTLPKLIEATDRWSAVLSKPAEDDEYKIVQRTALDALKDMRSTAEEMETSLTAYFKDHPEALKAEKQRASEPHAPRDAAGPQ